MESKLLFENEWLAILEIIHPELCPNGYTYSHEVKGGSAKIVIMPFRQIPGEVPVEWMLINEITLCWNGEEIEPHSLTGTVEEEYGIEETVKKELKEESGYDVDIDDLIFLGSCYGIKSSDAKYYLFTVDLTGKESNKPDGDGSALEDVIKPLWTKDINISTDPLAYVIHFKAFAYLIDNKII